MAQEEMAFRGLVETARLIAARKLTSEEVTRALLSRIEALDGRLASYALVLADEAIEAARALDRELADGTRRGPLHGVPIAVKDLCDMAGKPTAAGFPEFRDRLRERDSTVVARLRAAGAVILGKLQLTEGALALHHPDVPPPVNPWRADLWSGASSSGSGAATAAGLCYGSLGSDTGGSIRFPAHANGLVGLKPTWGRVSRAGVFPLSDTLDHIGPITRHVEDAAVMLQAIAGHDEEDPTSLSAPVPNYLLAAAAGAAGLRVGVDRDYCSRDLAPEVARTIAQAIDVLEGQGATIVAVSMPESATAVAGWGPICATEAALAHKELRAGRPSAYSAVFGAFLDLGDAASALDYARATIDRREYAGSLAALFDEVDAVIAPVIPDTVYTVEAFAKLCEEPEGLARLIAMTSPYDLTGSPVLTMPAGLTSDGVPLGYQLVGRHLEEGTLLRLGQAYQDAMPARTRPSL